MKYIKYFIAISAISAITLFDLITKQIAAANLIGEGSKTIIKYILEFSYVENDGAAFGMLGGKKFLFFILTLIALGIFGYMLSYIDLKKKKTYTSALILLIGGTLGNAIDRISLGYVIDFIRFPFIDKFINLMKIPGFICNIADIYLTFGIILFVIDLIFFRRKSNKRKDENIILKNESEDNNKEN